MVKKTQIFTSFTLNFQLR